MSEKTKRAAELHNMGYNCAQAVAAVFAEDLDVHEKDLFRIMEAFGFGMGTMGTCGAVSGMAAVVGMARSDGNMDSPKTKRFSYADMKALTKKFEEKNKSVICCEIKGVGTGEVLRDCAGCIEDAVMFLEEYLADKE